MHLRLPMSRLASLLWLPMGAAISGFFRRHLARTARAAGLLWAEVVVRGILGCSTAPQPLVFAAPLRPVFLCSSLGFVEPPSDVPATRLLGRLLRCLIWRTVCLVAVLVGVHVRWCSPPFCRGKLCTALLAVRTGLHLSTGSTDYTSRTTSTSALLPSRAVVLAGWSTRSFPHPCIYTWALSVSSVPFA